MAIISPYGLTHALEQACPDLWSLSVECNGQTRIKSLFLLVLVRGGPAVLHSLSMVLVGAVGEVHAGNVHASVDHVHQVVDVA